MPGWIEGNEILVGSVGKASRHYSLDLGFPPGASDDLSAKNPEGTANLARDLDAYVVTGLHTLERRLASPKRE
jgi:hypothetical protein